MMANTKECITPTYSLIKHLTTTQISTINETAISSVVLLKADFRVYTAKKLFLNFSVVYKIFLKIKTTKGSILRVLNLERGANFDHSWFVFCSQVLCSQSSVNIMDTGCESL